MNNDNFSKNKIEQRIKDVILFKLNKPPISFAITKK